MPSVVARSSDESSASTGAVASTLQHRQLRDAYLDRMTAVAFSVARLPAIIDAFDDEDPAATIQPIAEVIREASDVTYVVVTDDEGVRYSHPDPTRIGETVSTDPSVPLSGEVWTGTQTGTPPRASTMSLNPLKSTTTKWFTRSLDIASNCARPSSTGRASSRLRSMCSLPDLHRA